jgi:2,3-bisphosphoglycerate-independent phosphoglycerate mutase
MVGIPDPKISAIDIPCPFINSLYNNYPSAQLRTDGLHVGHQMGKWEIAKSDT